MRRRSRQAAEAAASFGKLETNRLTWIGFGLVAVGWALLICGVVLVDILLAKSQHLLGPSVHADIIDLAKCVIASGFALAIIGALRSGFGTLNSFFSAVLTRSAQRESEPVRPAEPVVERQPPAPVTGKRRPYRMFPDGSVEVETILGTRLFKTMTEARDFI